MIGKLQALAPYYRLLARKIALAIVVVACIPYALTFGLFYSSYNDSTQAQVLGSLRGVVETHKRDIDEFLADRLSDLAAMAGLLGVEELQRPESLRRAFNALQDAHGAFVDLGLIDARGRHLAYAGPYRLMEANYSQSPWFQEVLAKGTFISDVFLGFRGVPHFVVALKLPHEGGPYLLRATIDSARFASLVEKVRLGQSGEAFIVNRQGLYQTQGRERRHILAPSGLALPEAFEGVRVWETTAGGREVVLAQAWLKDGDWLLVCQQDTSDAFEPLYRARRLVLAWGLAAMALLVGTTVLLTRGLVGRIAAADHDKELLNEQIIQAGKLASLGELAAGVAHEINNPLAIMVEEAGWMQDLMQSDAGVLAQSSHFQEYQRAIEQIQTHGRRCKEITVKLLGFARSTFSPLQPTQLNELAREVAGLVERPARYANVNLTLDLDPELPQIMASPTELQQVLMNLVNNAMDAMEEQGGSLFIRTRQEEKGGVLLEVADTGPGIPEAVLSRIFDPFFTTKPVGKGTGLGLSICYGIVHKLGGRLQVQSAPQQGATFRVHLPARPLAQSKPESLKAAA
ncbi:MAG: two-component sensor histidine kinase [Desulfarculus sp.]|nr:two-component sensor histidine kinase [Desulfarculus sp.]